MEQKDKIKIEIDDGQPKASHLLAPLDFVAHWDENITDNQYHADRTSVGSGQVRQCYQSPYAFYDKYYGDNQVEEEEEDHFKVGKMVHMAILEHQRFKDLYVVMPEFIGLTKDGKPSAQSKEAKEKRQAWMSDLPPGAMVCTKDQLDMITGIAQAIMRHPQGEQILKGCRPEVAGYYRDPETGIKCRIKPDLLRLDGKAMTDFKTAKSSDETFFGSQAFSLRHDMQLFMYKEGARIINGQAPEMVFSLAVEKKRPYEPAIFFWNQEDLAQAEYDYRAGLRKMRECIDSGKWPYRQVMIERIRTPQWFIYQSVNKEN